MSENRKCTIVDVARAAGTSTATVSRILSGSDYPISAQLRKKVMQVAQDLNYKPNLIGKMLQSGVGEKEIGVVLPSIVNPFYGSLMSAVEEECVQRSYVPILCLSQNSSRLESQHIEMLGQKQVSGILLSCVPFPVSWTVKMKKKQKETQDILSYHTQAAGCSDKARAKASGGRQPIEECGRTGL